VLLQLLRLVMHDGARQGGIAKLWPMRVPPKLYTATPNHHECFCFAQCAKPHSLSTICAIKRQLFAQDLWEYFSPLRGMRGNVFTQVRLMSSTTAHDPPQHQNLVLRHKHPIQGISISSTAHQLHQVPDLRALPITVVISPEDSLDPNGMHVRDTSITGP
jgi:hypothetical protein